MLSRNRPFPSEERGAATEGEFQNVFPDGYGSLTRTPPSIPPGIPAKTFADSVLFEAKALTNRVLTLEYPFSPPDAEDPEERRKFQILGHLDAAANTAAAADTVSIPIVAFLTTADTTVGADAIQFAGTNRVAIAHYIPCKRWLFPTRAEMRMSTGEILNPGVYIGQGRDPESYQLAAR